MTTTVLLVGAGAVGARAARQLTDTAGVDRVLVVERRKQHAEAVVAAMGARAEVLEWDADSPLPEGVSAVACGSRPVPSSRSRPRGRSGGSVRLVG